MTKQEFVWKVAYEAGAKTSAEEISKLAKRLTSKRQSRMEDYLSKRGEKKDYQYVWGLIR